MKGGSVLDEQRKYSPHTPLRLQIGSFRTLLPLNKGFQILCWEEARPDNCNPVAQACSAAQQIMKRHVEHMALRRSYVQTRNYPRPCC